MNKLYRLITFDVYTALFDIENSLTPLVQDNVPSATDALRFVRVWRRKQLEYTLISNSLLGTRIPFEAVTRRALDDTLARADLQMNDETRTVLVDAWRDLQPWPEATDVLNTLKARGYTLGLLSNGDTNMLRALLLKLPAVLGHGFSSEQAGYYKPHPDIYALPLKSLNLQAKEILHVAGSPTDVLGAKAAGLDCAWSNREGQPHLDPAHAADYEMKDLAGLLDILQ